MEQNWPAVTENPLIECTRTLALAMSRKSTQVAMYPSTPLIFTAAAILPLEASGKFVLGLCIAALIVIQGSLGIVSAACWRVRLAILI